MPYIAPDVSERWIRARLLESTALTEVVSTRIHPLRADFQPIGWPYVLIDGSRAHYDNWAEMVTLEHADYRVYVVMREDQLPTTPKRKEMMEYLQPLQKAIYLALEGVSNYVSPTGFVHSSQIVAPVRRYYGTETLHIGELGVVVRLVAS